MSTLLFLHGALGAAEQFGQLAGMLPSSLHTRALDFPGHGQNANTTPCTIQAFADCLVGQIEAMAVGKVSVFGYSMGGYVALYAAALRPDLFDRVMTLATKMEWSEAIAAKEKAMLDPDLMLQKIPAFTEQLQRMHRHTDWRDMLRQTASLMDDLGRAPLLTPERLHAIEVRVRLCLGDKDSMVSLEETIAAYRNLSHGSLCVLPDTKHPLEKVDPKHLLEQIRLFFMR